MKLIVGLGNPGKEYEKTRHNAGFMMIDYYAKIKNLTTLKEFKNGLYYEYNNNGEKILLLKPQSYMNLSGEVVRKYIEYFKIDINDVLIINDDMDINLGNVKIKSSGSAAGHNGIKNIIQNLKSESIKRIKIGISKNNINQVDYVIGKFNKEELDILENVKKEVANIIEDFINIDFDKVMSKYNKKNK